jgi:hydroxymethylglutaryl-CoA synthase
MAANAVLRLIEQYDVDPGRVRYLALGTESSTDNSAGAIIIKGMVDEALKRLGRNALSRNCEVPEFKHACLGGIYGLKNALRFLSTDGDDSLAIVVCSDKALYERGSSGEPTQGAGAVAMLLSSRPTIGRIDLRESGTASDYRGVDFRKPLVNRNGTGASPEFVDIPVFNGKYSTSCYVDEIQRSLEDMLDKRQLNAMEYFRNVTAVFMHRPYQRMPETGWGMAYLFALARGGETELALLRRFCAAAGVSIEKFMAEAECVPDLASYGVRERITDEIFPTALNVLREFRNSEIFDRYVGQKMALGTDHMRELGNLYTGALPAWLAAGLEEASARNLKLDNQEVLLVGYGSGDAADSIPMHILPGWQDAVASIEFAKALKPSIDLSHDQYVAFRDRTGGKDLGYSPHDEFVVERIGHETTQSFQDAGIEYYRYIQ